MIKVNGVSNEHKLWFAWTNTGNWGGITKYCCVAKTKAEAEEKMGLAPYRENRRYDVIGPFEMTGKNILDKLVTCGGTDGFELSYTIETKKKEAI